MRVQGWGYLVALALICWVPGCQKTSGLEVAFTPRVPDPAEVTAQLERDSKELGDYTPGKSALITMEYLEKVNLLAASRERSLSKLNQAMQDLKVAAKRCISDEGIKPLRRLSLFLLVRFEVALEELVAAAKTKSVSTALLTGAQPPDEIVDAYLKFARIGGDFLLHAANAGLAKQSSSGKIEFVQGAPFFMRLAFKVRLANILPEATDPMSWMMSDFERKWYDIWVVERSRTASLARKLKALERLKAADAAYPYHQAAGIVFYQARDYARAIKAFNQALKEKPDDRRIKDYLQAAESRAD